MYSASGGAVENVSALLRAGARLESRNTNDGWTALHFVTRGSIYGIPGPASRACSELLLCAGADVAASTYDLRTPLDLALTFGNAAAAPLLLGFGSPLRRDSTAAFARAVGYIPEAAAIAQRQLDALTAPEALPAAAAALEARLEAAAAPAVAAAGEEDDAEAASAFARLRLLSSGELPWEEAWKHAPPEQQRTRFSGGLDRLAWAQALLACSRKAEPVSAGRAISVLLQLSRAQDGSREREKLTYAAARCVAKWWTVKHAGADAQVELYAAQAGFEASRERGLMTIAGIQSMMQEAAAQQQQAQQPPP